MSEDMLEKFINKIADKVTEKVISKLDGLLDRKLRSTLYKEKAKKCNAHQIILDSCHEIEKNFTAKDIYNFLQDSKHNKSRKISRQYISGVLWYLEQHGFVTLVKKGSSKTNPNIYINVR